MPPSPRYHLPEKLPPSASKMPHELAHEGQTPEPFITVFVAIVSADTPTPSRLAQMRMQLLDLFLLWSMILARHTDHLRLRAAPPSARVFDYHCGQLPAFEAPGVEPLAVLGQLQATARVVAVDDGGAEAARKTSLVFVPELRRRLARSMTTVFQWTIMFTCLGPRRTVGTGTGGMRVKVNSPHAHYG